jgi:hypothetical protein
MQSAGQASSANAKAVRTARSAYRCRVQSNVALAGVEAQVVAATAALAGHNDHVIAGKALKVFTKRVRANQRRLSRR